MAYNIAPHTDETSRGGLVLHKTAGQANPGVGSEFKIPIMGAGPRNPRNFSYPFQANAAAGPINGVMGKRTPLFPVQAALQGTWATANLINDIIGGDDTEL